MSWLHGFVIAKEVIFHKPIYRPSGFIMDDVGGKLQILM
jgi:hypothetical protein